MVSKSVQNYHSYIEMYEIADSKINKITSVITPIIVVTTLILSSVKIGLVMLASLAVVVYSLHKSQMQLSVAYDGVHLEAVNCWFGKQKLFEYTEIESVQASSESPDKLRSPLSLFTQPRVYPHHLYDLGVSGTVIVETKDGEKTRIRSKKPHELANSIRDQI